MHTIHILEPLVVIVTVTLHAFEIVALSKALIPIKATHTSYTCMHTHRTNDYMTGRKGSYYTCKYIIQ